MDDRKNEGEDKGKDNGKNNRYDKSIPFRHPLPSRQRNPDEWFDLSVQKTNFWFDRVPLSHPINASGWHENRGYENHFHHLSGASSV